MKWEEINEIKEINDICVRFCGIKNGTKTLPSGSRRHSVHREFYIF